MSVEIVKGSRFDRRCHFSATLGPKNRFRQRHESLNRQSAIFIGELIYKESPVPSFLPFPWPSCLQSFWFINPFTLAENLGAPCHLRSLVKFSDIYRSWQITGQEGARGDRDTLRSGQEPPGPFIAVDAYRHSLTNSIIIITIAASKNARRLPDLGLQASCPSRGNQLCTSILHTW